MWRIGVLILVFIGIEQMVRGQDCGAPGAYCMANSTINICGGTIVDDAAGGSYSDTPYTMVICPDNPGDVIQLDFTAFALQTSPNGNNSDYLSIYDGDTSGAAPLGDYTGTSLQGVAVTGTINNVTGCLTLVFDPNGNANSGFPGFNAAVSCTTPCAPPTSSSIISNPSPLGIEQSVSVCLNSPVTFSDNGSFAQPGFTLEQYIWNFDDGSVDTLSGAIAEHVFTEPGEYIVTLTVADNNGCTSSNIQPLQVLVSTIPQFPGIASNPTNYCFGESINLTAGEVINTTWTALPPQVSSGTTLLNDGAGFSFSNPLVFDFFEPGAVLENCADFLSVMVNMEHSYMGDLNISLTCPDGTTVTLVEWGVNGGGGTYLGIPCDDPCNEIGTGFTYLWDPLATNGTWGQNTAGFGGTLAAGAYESQSNLCALVGCPLNGEWLFTVTDNLGADDGYIFEWGLNFATSLYPNVTSFTPVIGAGADSSYWSGPQIEWMSTDADDVIIELTEPGSYDYIYTAINNFGCTFDTTITIVVEQSPLVTAGPDIDFNCQPVDLVGGYADLPTPICTVAEGSYSYCYADNANYSVTYCPDNPGDGISFVEIDIIAGEIETFFDNFTVYNGNSTSAPILAGPINGDLSGQTYVATNASGCLTFSIVADFTSSCASGAQNELQYNVLCASPFQYEWAWTPSTNLSNPQSPLTTLNSLSSTTTYTLTGYPVGHPDCGSSDDVVVSVPTNLVVDIEGLYEVCTGEGVHVNAPVISGGTAPYDFHWETQYGETFNNLEFDYIPYNGETGFCGISIDQCGVVDTTCGVIYQMPVIPATFTMQNYLGCEPQEVLMVSDYMEYQNIARMVWHFADGDSASTIASSNHDYHTAGTYYPWLEIVDLNGCTFADTTETPVLIWPTPFANFEAAPSVNLLPNTTFAFSDLSIDASQYQWTFDAYGQGTAADTSFSFPTEIAASYLVGLKVSNQYGCSDSTYRQVIVEDEIDVYIPNSFTPDGDGINDFWFIDGKGFQELGYHMQVFNRWGDLVFESIDTTQPWTGSSQNGNHYVPDGVYTYLAKFRDNQNDVNYTYKGYVVVLR
jgi:gliding motility-associated-like protein